MYPNLDNEQETYIPKPGDLIMQQARGENVGPCGIVIDVFESSTSKDRVFKVLMNRRLVTRQQPEYLTLDEMRKLLTRPTTKERFENDLEIAQEWYNDKFTNLYDEWIRPKLTELSK